ncbi:hypothetical protein ACGFNV_45815 [Streptomyces sp. NPDC048751]
MIWPTSRPDAMFLSIWIAPSPVPTSTVAIWSKAQSSGSGEATLPV